MARGRDWFATLRQAQTVLIPAEEARSLLSDMSAALDSSDPNFARLRPSDVFQILDNIRPLFEAETDHLRIRLFVMFWGKWKCSALVLLRGLSGDFLSFGNQQLLDCLKTVHLAPLPTAESQPNPAMPDDDDYDDPGAGGETYVPQTQFTRLG
jgi:hypothetical protein